MRHIFYIAIIATLFLCTGCDDKKDDNNQSTQTTNTIEANQTNKIIKPKKKIKNRFTITDIDNRSTTISFANNTLKVNKVAQSIVIINVFSDWSAPCQGMIPYLNDLQKTYKKDIFVIGVLANSDMNNTGLREFMQKNSVSYFISNNPDNDQLAQRLATDLKLDDNYPIPLTIIIKDGKYMVYYIGATPVEMLKSDIEQLKVD